jgi:hypothetical protein
MHPCSHANINTFDSHNPPVLRITVNLPVDVHLHVESELERGALIHTFAEGTNLIPRKGLNAILAATNFAGDGVDRVLSEELLRFDGSLPGRIPHCTSISRRPSGRGLRETSLVTVVVVAKFMIMEASSIDMNKPNRPSPQRVPPLARDVYLRVTPDYVNSNVSVSKWSVRTEDKI